MARALNEWSVNPTFAANASFVKYNSDYECCVYSLAREEDGLSSGCPRRLLNTIMQASAIV